MAGDKNLKEKKKKFYADLIAFCKSFYSKSLKFPTYKRIQLYAEKDLYKKITLEEARLVRNSLELHTKYYKLGDRHAVYAKIRTTTLGWVQTDLFFITFRGKKYGSGMLFVDILSKKVFITSIGSKKLDDIKKAIEKAKAFMPIRRLYSDKESSLKSLEQKNLDFKSIKFITTLRKAVIAERFIYTFKRWMSQYLTNESINVTQWRSHIAKIQRKMNDRIIAKGDILNQRIDDVTPNRLNSSNIGLYVSHLLVNNPGYYQSLYKIYTPANPKLFFKFKLGDIVYISKKIDPTMDRYKYAFDSKSFYGHFEKKKTKQKTENSYKIIQRRLLVSQKNRWVAVYDVKKTFSPTIIHNVYERYIRPFPV